MLLRETPLGQNAHVLPGLHPAQGLKLELAAKSGWFVRAQPVLPQEGELSPFSVSHARGSLQMCHPSLRPHKGNFPPVSPPVAPPVETLYRSQTYLNRMGCWLSIPP